MSNRPRAVTERFDKKKRWQSPKTLEIIRKYVTNSLPERRNLLAARRCTFGLLTIFKHIYIYIYIYIYTYIYIYIFFFFFQELGRIPQMLCISFTCVTSASNPYVTDTFCASFRQAVYATCTFRFPKALGRTFAGRYCSVRVT